MYHQYAQYSHVFNTKVTVTIQASNYTIPVVWVAQCINDQYYNYIGSNRTAKILPLNLSDPIKGVQKPFIRMQQVSLNSKTLTILSTLNIVQAKIIGEKGAETHLGTINIALAL